VKTLLLPERTKGVCSPPPRPIPERRVDRTVDMLKALADPTRLQMVGMLQRAQAPVCICDFTAAFRLSQPTISHHMAKLKAAGLVDVTRRGIWAYYRLHPQLDQRSRAALDLLV